MTAANLALAASSAFDVQSTPSGLRPCQDGFSLVISAYSVSEGDS
jgi:hypothetical protein